MKIERSAPHLLINGVSVLVTWEPLPKHGGDRPSFQCPVCGRRCKFLYFRGRPACRQCEGLDWPSRHLHRGTPEIHRIRRLRERIGADPAPFSPLSEPPPRRRVWFRRIAVRIAIEEATLLGHLARINADLERRRRVRGWNRPV